jgi:DNA processing protein
MTDERLAYLALALTPGIGPTRLRSLERYFGSWNGALSAPFALLRSVPSMNAAAASAVAMATRAGAYRVLERAEALGATILFPDDTRFPGPLTGMDDPPAVLFAQGRLDLLGAEAVAIVGTRHPTSYGIDVTRRIARVAGLAGLVVVSGMARGLDAVAHRAALDCGAATIGVLGNGLGVVYPAANAMLYRTVAAEGLLLTEYPPGERPNAGSFACRNRMISGLARVTVVTEAAEKSGALITARSALDQGRDVMAVPGPLSSRQSAGTNALIQHGAFSWLEPRDLLDRFPGLSRAARERAAATPEPDERVGRLERHQRRVFDALDGMPRMVDQIGHELGLSAQEVLAALTELELAGLVDPTPAGYVRS